VIDAQVNICGQCHPSELESYLENYHGKTAVDLDFADSTSCADCHGSHHFQAIPAPNIATNIFHKDFRRSKNRLVCWLTSILG